MFEFYSNGNDYEGRCLRSEEEITGAEADEEIKSRKDSPHYCIFEEKICRYAEKDGSSFECTCPDDASMPCKR